MPKTNITVRQVTDLTFHADPKALADAAAWVTKGIGRPAIPILAAVRLDVAGDALTLSAFDYEVAEQAEVELHGGFDGTALVSGRLFAELVKALPNKLVKVFLLDGKLHIECGTVKATLPTMPLEDYPTLPALPDVVGSVDAGDFTTAVARVAVTVGRTDTLPVLTGLHLAFTENEIRVAGTDRYRAAIATVGWSRHEGGDFDVLVPGHVLADAAKAMTASEVINIRYRDGLIGFSGDGLRMTCRLLDSSDLHSKALEGMFPPPSDQPVAFDVAELAAAVKRARVVAEDGTPIRLTFTGTDIAVEAVGKNDETIGELAAGKYAGRKVTVGLSAGYLLDALASLRSETAELTIQTSRKPVLLVAPEDPTFRHLMMPIRMGGNPE